MAVNKFINIVYNDYMWFSKFFIVIFFWEFIEFSFCRMFCNRLWYNGGIYFFNMYGSMDYVQLYVYNILFVNRYLGKDLQEVNSYLLIVVSNVVNSKYSLISKR